MELTVRDLPAQSVTFQTTELSSLAVAVAEPSQPLNLLALEPVEPVVQEKSTHFRAPASSMVPVAPQKVVRVTA
jgi:hypothetical protein